MLGLGCLLLAACSRPAANFQVEKSQTNKAPARVQFMTDMTGLDSVRWHFGDGSTSSKPKVTHTYWMSGRYEVELNVWKGNRKGSKSEELIVSPPDKCLVRIQTPEGDMIAELYDATPAHRDNFTRLAEEHFYDSLLFHRVIEGFMIQGGDPLSRRSQSGAQLGTGGPGYQIPAEFVDTLLHYKGSLAAARMGDQVNPEKKSSGSQFYIVQGNPVPKESIRNIEQQKGIHYTEEQKARYEEVGGTPFLDHDYTVFGRVLEGMEVIDRIAARKTDRANRPLEDVPMVIRVIR